MSAPEYFFDIAQGSESWHELRRGVPTASEFGKVIATRTQRDRTSRDTYMRKLAGEILTGRPVENVDTANFRRGHEMEPKALAWYAMMFDVQIEPVGFVRLGRLGASPDALVGRVGMIEAKSAAPHVQIERLLRASEEKGYVPDEYREQVDGQLLVCQDRLWVDFISYCEGLPPLVTRVTRNPRRMAELRVALDQFISELDQMVERIKEM